VIRLHPKVSHLQIVPVLVLCLLTIAFADVDILHTDWEASVKGHLIATCFAIGCFYLAIPLLRIFQFGESSNSPDGDSTTADRSGERLLASFSYFGFICQVFMLSAVEALFTLELIATITHNQTAFDKDSTWGPTWLPKVLLVFLVAHFWCERKKLGRTAVVADEQMDTPTSEEGTNDRDGENLRPK
jgi:hypothetical protein